MPFLKKINPGLWGIKCPFFKVFDSSSKTAVRICPIFCMVVEGNRAHCLSQTAFLKRFWITNCRGLSAKEWCLGCYSPKWCYDDSIALHDLYRFHLHNAAPAAENDFIMNSPLATMPAITVELTTMFKPPEDFFKTFCCLPMILVDALNSKNITPKMVFERVWWECDWPSQRYWKSGHFYWLVWYICKPFSMIYFVIFIAIKFEERQDMRVPQIIYSILLPLVPSREKQLDCSLFIFSQKNL